MSHWRTTLANYLLAILDGERAIEYQRVVLASIPEFEPYTAFQRFDRSQKKYISLFDLENFLNETTKWSKKESLLKLVIQHYDRDNDMALNFQEFLKLFLTFSDDNLRAKVTQRRVYHVGYTDLLLVEIENQLAKIIKMEMDFYDEILIKKDGLKYLYGFSTQNAFNYIDYLNDNFIDEQSLILFFKKVGYFINQQDAKYLINRLDRNCDGKICYEDFSYYFNFNPYQEPSKEKINYLNYEDKLKESQTKFTNENKISDSTGKNFSHSNSNCFKYNFDYSNTNKLNNLSSNGYSFLSNREDKSPNYDSLILSFFQKVILLETKAEKVRQNFSIKAQTHINNIFRLFDPNEHGYITQFNFREAMNNLNIFVTNEEVKLIFRRYDPDQDSKISFREFNLMINPMQEEYSNLLQDKNLLEMKLGESGLLDLAGLMRVIIDVENQIQKMRRNTCDKPYFLAREAFNMLKGKIKNYFIRQDVNLFICNFRLKNF